MSTDGLTPGHGFLREAARICFAERYGNPRMHVNKPLSPKLEWVPALRFSVHKHINVFVEPSDDGPYPRMLAMRSAEVRNYPEPIAIYSVCHDAATTTPSGRADCKRLKAHGFGLVTVDPDGGADIQFPTIPLVQAISEADFKRHLKGLPNGIRQPASEAFEDYQAKPVNGVKTLSELIEGMITKAGKDSATRGGITMAISQSTQADVLDALYNQHGPARAAIGGARKFIKECRNLSHHWPRNKKDAYQRYSDCRHHFLEGLRTIRSFRQAMKSVGLSGNVARS